MTPLILVDVSWAAYRAHFSHAGLSYGGQPTGTYYGFLKDLLRLRQQVSKRIIFCWDHGVPTGAVGGKAPCWRRALLKDYKATRIHSEGAAIVQQQLPHLYQVLKWLGYSCIGIPGLEADDCMGIIASASPQEDILIYSPDKDMYQLLTANNSVRVMIPAKEAGKRRYITAAEVVREYGVPINRWAEYLALGGDSADNIKPAKGMGPKGAAKLIRAGADPKLSWVQQQPAFRNLYPKLEACWPRIEVAYQAALLPRHWRDSRITKLVDNHIPVYSLEEPVSIPKGRKLFEGFLGDYGLVELFGIRQDFY